jgi:hypothetical protein
MSQSMVKCLGDSFVWFSRERKIYKRASGGVGIICRKSIGNFLFIKSSVNFEILWVKLDGNGDQYFIGAVYIPPKDLVVMIIKTF